MHYSHVCCRLEFESFHLQNHLSSVRCIVQCQEPLVIKILACIAKACFLLRAVPLRRRCRRFRHLFFGGCTGPSCHSPRVPPQLLVNGLQFGVQASSWLITRSMSGNETEQAGGDTILMAILMLAYTSNVPFTLWTGVVDVKYYLVIIYKTSHYYWIVINEMGIESFLFLTYVGGRGKHIF